MSTELTTAVAPDVSENLHLVARTPDEMRIAQGQLAQWFENKKTILMRDAVELEESRDIAKRNGWKTEATLAKHARLARRRIEFYDKCQQAVASGYAIVPNFDVDLFAIRTARSSPRPNESTSRWNTEAEQGSEGPPAGVGELVAAKPLAEAVRRQPQTNYKGEPIKDDQGKVKTQPVFRATEFDEEIDFPIAVARPEIMTATQAAMALEIFDEFGVQAGATQQSRMRGDPLVVGRIIDPRSTTYNRKWVTFLIAWYVNTADL